LGQTQLAREVAAGQRSLVEAAALFRELNRLSPDVSALTTPDFDPSPLSDPVHTKEERLCRQVVQWVDTLRLVASPEYADAAVARLNAEYRELRKHGEIRLPDSSSLPSNQTLLEFARKAMPEVERRALLKSRKDTLGGR
jgi:hypothetical protein